jgi:hypothetical protein
MGIITNRIAELGEPRPRDVGQPLQQMIVVDGRRGCFRAVETNVGGVPCIFIQTLQSIDYGGGREALLAIIRLADELGCVVRLKAKPYRTPLHKMPKTQEQLIRYYEGYGFRVVGEHLEREPLTPIKGN